MKPFEIRKAQNEALMKRYIENRPELKKVVDALKNHKGRACITVGKKIDDSMQVFLKSYIANLLTLISSCDGEPQIIISDMNDHRRNIVMFVPSLMRDIDVVAENDKIKGVLFSHGEVDYIIDLIS